MSGSSSCIRLSTRSGGSIAALRTGRIMFGSGTSSFRDSSVVVLVLMRATRDGVLIVLAVRVSCRWFTFRCIAVAVVSNPVNAIHFIGLLSINVGPVV